MTERIAPTRDASTRVARVLASGGVALIPTDTVYGLVADPENAAAIARIYNLKGRPERQPIAVLVSSDFPLARIAAEVPAIVHLAIEKFWARGCLTIVLQRKSGHMDAIAAGTPTVGLRSPEHPFTQEVIRIFDRPIGATSANISGQPSTGDLDLVDPAIVDGVDLTVDGGPCPISVPSTVVDFSVIPPKVIRIGAISPAELSDALCVKLR